MSDDAFEPRLGRMRGKSDPTGRTYLEQVLAAARRASMRRNPNGPRFSGTRIGRGASIARVLGACEPRAAFHMRRVVVKTKLVRLGPKGLAAAGAHLRYLERDGVARDGSSGRLYSADLDAADGKAFLERCGGDRHQFRFIVSAEDADQYPDLKPLIRRLMAQMEVDLGTRLDWVAVDHFNTGHPHSHVIVRGKDDRGQNLVIARDYIAHGLRERASRLVTLDLGPRTMREIEARLRQDIGAERLTEIDRRLLRDRDAAGTVSISDRDPFQQALRAGRLQKLQKLGLATDLGGGRWQLADGVEETLRRIGERGDIIRTMQRALTERRLERADADRIIFDPTEKGVAPIVGRVVARGLADELVDRHYLIIDGVDGRSHYVEIGKGEGLEPLPTDAVVRIVPRSGTVREVDRTIVAVAAENGGRYDVDAHLRHDPAASEAFAETHVRRLEAMRRVMKSVERQADGSWIIASDHFERAAAFEQRQLRDRPVTIETLSTVSLEQMTRADAATWLDRELVADNPVPLRDAGFGGEVRAAQAVRRQWLVDQQLTREAQGRFTFRPDMIAALERRELLRVASQLSEELGLAFAEAKAGERIEGVLKRPVDLASRRFALVETSREFMLVPWRPVLERWVGRQVSGVMRPEGISWTIGRERGGPSVS